MLLWTDRNRQTGEIRSKMALFVCSRISVANFVHTTEQKVNRAVRLLPFFCSEQASRDLYWPKKPLEPKQKNRELLRLPLS